MKRFPLNIPITTAMIAFHIGAIIALFFPTWQRFYIGLGSWFVFGSLGVCMTYHRLLTHRGFKTYQWFEYLLTTIACLPLQGDPIKWVAQHRKHHKYVEQPGLDPHTPRDGKWWSHMGWLMYSDPTLGFEEEQRKWVPDLFKHSFYIWLRTFFWIPTTVWGVICFAIGGIPLVLWGVALPVVIGWHFTWLVNSATHLWGRRRFPTRDDSRNSFWVALLTWGEGWHNNHHFAPVLARHGIVWWEVDVTWYIIKALQGTGLVWEVKD